MVRGLGIQMQKTNSPHAKGEENSQKDNAMRRLLSEEYEHRSCGKVCMKVTITFFEFAFRKKLPYKSHHAHGITTTA